MHPRKVELVQKPTCKAKITSELLLKPLESNCGDILKLLIERQTGNEANQGNDELS